MKKLPVNPLDFVLDEDRAQVRSIRFLVNKAETSDEVDTIAAVELEIGVHRLYITVNNSDDTIVITSDFSPAQTSSSLWRSVGSEWNKIIGMRIQWFWWLTNNQGYRDGLQIEFTSDALNASETIQCTAIASHLSIRKVCEESP